MKQLFLLKALLAISFSLMAGGPAKTYKNPVVNSPLQRFGKLGIRRHRFYSGNPTNF